jgi:hypothetical protein
MKLRPAKLRTLYQQGIGCILLPEQMLKFRQRVGKDQGWVSTFKL